MNNYNSLFKTGIIVLALCLSAGVTSYAGSYYGDGNQNENNNNNNDNHTRGWWWDWYHQQQNNNNNSHDDDDNGNTNNNNSHDDDDDNGNWNNNNSDDDDDDDGCTGEVTSLTVVKKGTGATVGTLYDGIKLNDDCDLNIKAHVACEDEIGSVEFILNGNTHRVENNGPFTLGGNSGSYYNDMNLPAGSYLLKVIPWSGTNGTGTQGDALEVHFWVVDIYGNRNSDCIVQSNDNNNNDNGNSNNNNDDDDDGNYNNNNDNDDDNGNTNNNNSHDDDDDNGNSNNNNSHDDDDDNGNSNNNNSHDDDDDSGNSNNNNSHDDDDDNGNSNNNNGGCSTGGEVTSLTLVRGGTSDEIGYLYDGYTIDRDCGVNIRANVACEDKIRSVVFILNGNVLQVENSAPYTAGGDLSGVYKSLPDSELPLGSNHLKVVPYSGTGGGGTAGDSYELWFTVVDEDCNHDDDDDGNNNNNSHDDDDDNGNSNDNNSHDDDDDNGNSNDNNSHDDDDDNGNSNDNNSHDDDDDNGNSNNNNNNYKTSGSSVNEGDVIRVFPNPTAGEFEIRLSLKDAGDINVRLFDVSGKVIVEESKLGFTGVYNKHVDLRQQSVGIYFLSVNVNGKITTEKILYNR